MEGICMAHIQEYYSHLHVHVILTVFCHRLLILDQSKSACLSCLLFRTGHVHIMNTVI